ncbi:hypothetical protein [Deinococcus sp. QL22]|uniref:hypothetical protein n=1 Tax=Deinococcus sp. QL22 TaxID=2939437 RepID=UPI0020177036|nr:hypothetical protein [Deinococcus sp. QL22]UQN10552.1 hypothetical protein M1R55_30590 [Deinococcus sp. QL22]
MLSFFRGVLLAFLLSPSWAAAEVTFFNFDPPSWDALLEIQDQVPGFAGFAGWCPDRSVMLGTVFPTLAQATQEAAERSPLLGPFLKSFKSCSQVVTRQYSVRTLVGVARQVLAANPKATVYVDTGLNRVVYTSPLTTVKAAWTPFLVDEREDPAYSLQLVLTPTAPSGLSVTLINLLNRPISVTLGSGIGAVTVYQGDRRVKPPSDGVEADASGAIPLYVPERGRLTLPVVVDVPLDSLKPGPYRLSLMWDWQPSSDDLELLYERK